jgi:hypothetical protein
MEHVHNHDCEPPGVAERDGIELVSYHCLQGRPGFKLAMLNEGSRWLLYLGHIWHPGWSILDVTDADAPKFIDFLEGPSDTWTLQVQVAQGLMLTALEKPPLGWGADSEAKSEEGCLVWDLSDPDRPTHVGTYRTGGTGTHRNFYAGGDYAYMAANVEGIDGRLLAIVDISNPSSPQEISRWSWPTQNESGHFASYMHGPAHVEGNRAYVSYGKVGALILDVSNPHEPALISHISLGGLGSRIGCHTALPYLDSRYLLVSGEAIDEGRDGEWNYSFIVDIQDETAPRVIGSLPSPRPSDGGESYWDRGGRFGIHNQHHRQGQPHLFPNDDRVFTTYFNAGLRVFDISDPYEPVERAHFVPGSPKARRGPLPSDLVTQFEDVLVDARGFIYCTDKNHGLFILRLEND